MSNCPHCGAAVAPNSRFCTECGKPMAAAGPAPMPPVPGPGPAPMPPVGAMPPAPGSAPMPPIGAMPPAPNFRPVPPNAMPPVGPAPGPAPMPPTPMSQMATPPMPGTVRGPQAPVPPAPQPMAPVAPQAQAQAAAAVLSVPATETFRLATVGDLLNTGAPVAVLVTDSQITVLQPGGAPIVEAVPGLRHAIIGDFDGDGRQELAVFDETQVWVLRYAAHGSVPSGKVTLKEVPAHLTVAPVTYDGGRTVLMSATAEQITFFALHPSKGLVEIGTTSVPAIEP